MLLVYISILGNLLTANIMIESSWRIVVIALYRKFGTLEDRLWYWSWWFLDVLWTELKFIVGIGFGWFGRGWDAFDMEYEFDEFEKVNFVCCISYSNICFLNK